MYLETSKGMRGRSKAAKRFNVFLSHSWQTKGPLLPCVLIDSKAETGAK